MGHGTKYKWIICEKDSKKKYYIWYDHIVKDMKNHENKGLKKVISSISKQWTRQDYVIQKHK